MTSALSEKGQVTIPKPLRDSLAWKPGTLLEFTEADGAVIVRCVRDVDPLAKLVGLLPRMDVDAAMVDLRGPAWNATDAEAPDADRGR